MKRLDQHDQSTAIAHDLRAIVASITPKSDRTEWESEVDRVVALILSRIDRPTPPGRGERVGCPVESSHACLPHDPDPRQ